MTPIHHQRPTAGPGKVLDLSPETAGWKHLSFSVVELEPGGEHMIDTEDHEIAVVTLGGGFSAKVEGESYELSRSSVFAERASVLYLPPGRSATVSSAGGARFAIGGARADDRYPVRLLEPQDTAVELRGGGAAHRQVGHILAPPIEAHRLILYEVYVPGGGWSGWPPHCHDGYDDSPYLEEVYYFETDPADGFCLHRNYRVDNDFDEIFSATSGDVVTVSQGYHSTAAAPGSNLYFLNYLAGELEHEQRTTPPCFDGRYTWIEADWGAGAMSLPTAGAIIES